MVLALISIGLMILANGLFIYAGLVEVTRELRVLRHVISDDLDQQDQREAN
jgi:hypothetical protein